MNPEKPNLSSSEYLEKRKHALTQKHTHRLHRMTQEALESRQNKRFQFVWVKPVLATAFSILLLVAVMLFKVPENPQQPVGQSASIMAKLPEWVTDTQVPLSLIENLEFYEWLAQQPNQQGMASSIQSDITLAINEFYQYRLGKRRASSNITERFSGAAFDARTLQNEGI